MHVRFDVLLFQSHLLHFVLDYGFSFLLLFHVILCLLRKLIFLCNFACIIFIFLPGAIIYLVCNLSPKAEFASNAYQGLEILWY